MLLGTSWYSKTSSNNPRISTETSMKKNGSLLGSLSHLSDPGSLQRLNNQETTLSQPCVCQSWLKKLCLGTKLRIWGHEKSRKNQATPIKPAVTIPECGYGLCNPAKTQPSSLFIKKNTICISGGSNRPLPAEMQSCDRATSMKITGYISTSMKLTLPSQIPSPTINAVM